ncbi:hypothetical protein [Mucilaginibacter sp.]|uniref:hypothetical protein n=1 Tax=Mucilaginibacter sp. TaxID=1882438 RepID=UPI002ED1EC5B
MFSENLLKSKAAVGWVPVTDLAQLNPQIVRLFFALLYEKYTPLFTANKVSDTFVSLAADPKNIQLTNNIYNFVMLAQTIDARIKQYNGMDPKARQTIKLKLL